MSIKIMSKVWEQSSHEGSPLLLLLALADHASDDGVCWPGIPRLAHKTRKTERHTKRLLVKLEESGEVYIAREVGRGNTNMYYITLGFDGEEMVHTLIKRFEFEPGEASEIAQQIIKRQKKGDTQDTFSGDGEDKKGDIQGQEKVTPGAEKVTPKDRKGDTAMSPESSLTVIKPSVGNRQKDSDFPENPKTPAPPSPGDDALEDVPLPRSPISRDAVRVRIAPSVGSGADSGKEQKHEKVETGHHSGHSARDSGLPTGTSPPSDAPDDSSGVCNGDDDGASAGADPLMMPFERRTAAARAEAGGNWADPGEDGVAHAGLVALHEAKGGSAPRKGTGTYDKEIGAIRQALSDRGVTDPRVAVMAAQMFVKEKPKLACPHYRSFVGDYGEYLGRAGERVDKADARAPSRAPSEEYEPVYGDDLEPVIEEDGDDKPGMYIKSQLQALMGSQGWPTFRRYILPARFFCEDGILRVIAADEEGLAWLKERSAPVIEKYLKGMDGPQEVQFEVQP